MSGKSDREAVSIVANGTGKGFEALKAGAADIGMASRQINAKEIGLLKDFQMQLPTTEIVVGMDGIAMVVNPGNPVATLTRQQVGEIYRGKITNWSELGGARE